MFDFLGQSVDEIQFGADQPVRVCFGFLDDLDDVFGRSDKTVCAADLKRYPVRGNLSVRLASEMLTWTVGTSENRNGAMAFPEQHFGVDNLFASPPISRSVL